MFHSFADETGRIAAEASLNTVPPPFYKNDVGNRLAEENGNVIINTDVSNFKYRVPGYVNDELIAASVDYDINISLPARFIDKIPVSDTIVCRAFVGHEHDQAPMAFSEMEKNVVSDTVWVFPRSGTKYHGADCSFIKNYPMETILTGSVRGRYSPCEICDPGGLSDGNLVYCFNTGNVYHRGKCPTVTKYVTSMDRSEAEKRGYTACSRCGGN